MSYTRQELAALDREELEKIFCSVMGVEGFMPYQYEVIAAMLRGEDVMAVMPTGSGKSACFQFLAAVSEGVTIVVEPITALMEDQVRRAGALSIPAQILSRSISAQKVKSVLPEQKLLFLSPETLTHPKFMALAREHLPDISMLVVDEAHCIPLWGASFRPAFLRISGFFRTLGRRVQTAAFTATSTPGMELQIKLALGMEEPFELRRELDPDSQRALFEMTGLDMQVVQISDRYYEQTHYLVLHDLLLPDKEPKAKGKQYLLSRAYKAIFPKDPSQSTDLPESTVNSCRVVKRWLSLRRTYDRLKKAGTVTEKAYHRYRRRAVYAYEDYRRRVLDKAMLRDKYQRLVSDLIWSCGHFEEGSKIIVYCTLRRTVDLLWERLSSEEELLSRGIGVLRYHAGMEGPEKRSSALDLAEKPECRVMLATIAFGMGIDNKDVRMVINYEFPHDVESYYQEIGRAGRDDRPAASLLYFYRPDIKRLEKIADNRKRSDAEGQSAEELLREAQRDLSGKRLREMLAVADSGSSSVETDRLIQHFLGAEDGDQPLSEDMRTVCSSPGSLYMNVCLPAYRILRGEYEPGRPEECVLGSSEKSPRVSFTLEGERIGWLDMMLANAVYTLYFGGDPEADPEKLFALLNGTVKASLTGEDREEILGRLRKMAAAVIEISWGERRFQGRFLPLDEEDGRLLCRETPPLFAYAEADGRRFFSVDLSWLNVTGRGGKKLPMTLENVKIRTFIAMRVHLLPRYRTDARAGMSDKTFNSFRLIQEDRRRKGMYQILQIPEERQRAVRTTAEQVLRYYVSAGIIRDFKPQKSFIGGKKEVVGYGIDIVSGPAAELPKELRLFGGEETERLRGELSFFDIMCLGARLTLQAKVVRSPGERSVLAMISGDDEISAKGELRRAAAESLSRTGEVSTEQGEVIIPRKWLDVTGPSGKKVVPCTAENIALRGYICWKAALGADRLDLEECRPLLAEKGRDKQEAYLRRMIPSILRHLVRKRALKSYKAVKDSAGQVTGYELKSRKKNRPESK